MGGDVEGDVFDGGGDAFAAGGGDVFGEDDELAEGDDGVVGLGGGEVGAPCGVLGVG